MWIRQTIGVVSLLLTILVLIALIHLWPINVGGQQWAGPFGLKLNAIPFEARLIYIVLLSGALGSLVYTLTSFARHMGTGDYDDAWAWWYILRIPIGMLLALIMYFALRGGFFAPTTSGTITAKDVVNPFGFAAIAALAGMFSKQAVDKLKELFDAIFKVSKKQGKITPKINSVSPASLTVGQKDTNLTLVGSGFTDQTIAQVNGIVRETKYLNGEAIDVVLTEADTAAKGELSVFTINTGKNGGTSPPVKVSVK